MTQHTIEVKVVVREWPGIADEETVYDWTSGEQHSAELFDTAEEALADARSFFG